MDMIIEVFLLYLIEVNELSESFFIFIIIFNNEFNESIIINNYGIILGSFLIIFGNLLNVII